MIACHGYPNHRKRGLALLKKPEILAPAGSLDAFYAAMASGADAIYLGGAAFGARAYADNFGQEQMAAAIRYAHLRGRKIYITVNTLIKDSEMAQALAYCSQLWAMGADALIVQDWGLLALLQQQLPQAVLSGSTQMSLHNSAGVQQAARWGLNRVILARETSLEDLKSICQQAPVECEIFIHGALCICYSGQCLFSSMVGGRSGNRGRCAQPCRLAYTCQDAGGETIGQGHLLSPKDFCGYPLLKELTESGAVSFKLEGRMKRPEYVATVTDVYAKGVGQAAGPEGFAPLPQEQKRLEQAFNREFTTAFLLGNEGSDLMSYQRPNNRGSKLGKVERFQKGKLWLKLDAELAVGDGVELWVTKGGRVGFTVDRLYVGGQEVQQAQAGQVAELACPGQPRPGDRAFKTYDAKLMAAAQQRYRQQQQLPLWFRLQAKQGLPLTLTAQNQQGLAVTYTSDYLPQPAQKHPADRETVLKQLDRLGGSGWTLAGLELELEPGLMLPASVLNNARREALALLEKTMLQPARKQLAAPTYSQPKPARPVSDCCLAVWVDSFPCAKAAFKNGAQAVYFSAAARHGLTTPTAEQIRELSQWGEVCYVLPRIATEQELHGWRNRLATWEEQPVTALLCGNAWGVELARQAGWTKGLRGDTGLNIFNTPGGRAWQQRGLECLALSLELNWQEIAALGGGWRKEALAHGNLEVMESAHCPLGALAGGCRHETHCSKPCLQQPFYSLTDEKGFRFPAYSDTGCRMHLFNAHKLCMIEEIPRFLQAGIETLRLDLRFLQPKQVESITACYQQALAAALAGRAYDGKQAKARIIAADPSTFTKGHYYRGVE